MPNVDRQAVVGTVIKLDQQVLHTFDRPGVFAVELPGGDDILYTIVKPVPSPTPVPVPVPPVVTPTPTPLPDTGNVVRVKSGSGSLTARSGTRFVAEGERAQLRSDTGIRLPDGVTDVTFEKIDFIGNGDKGQGIDAIARGCRRLKFIDCTWRNFSEGGTFHHPDMSDARRSEEFQDISFVRCRFLDMAGRGDKAGQGLFVMNVDGFTFDLGVIDGAGYAGGQRTEWVHGIYGQHGCRNFAVTRSIFSRCANVGVQARGPLHKDSDPDDGRDAGPSIIGNVFNDCAIGIMPNGPRATVRDNVIVTGHAYTKPRTAGSGGVYASVGELRMTGNVRVSGPNATSAGRIEGFFNRKRDHKDGWEWDKPTSTPENTGNVDRMNVRVDLSDIIDRGRRGGDIGLLVIEAQARVRAAVQ